MINQGSCYKIGYAGLRGRLFDLSSHLSADWQPERSMTHQVDALVCRHRGEVERGVVVKNLQCGVQDAIEA